MKIEDANYVENRWHFGLRRVPNRKFKQPHILAEDSRFCRKYNARLKKRADKKSGGNS
ncbi:hypothetical protein JV46_25470 [Solemya velum gill symbiont]|uniref:Uncharacterized protein n=1 Tax=Solemya velum gill symbiont TaxID=2340 RepID=A0A0B0H5Y2_SOVGS|nr:hypothetical protein [Solemya velum gill symbiont]KHF24515.1 hypothetical protein JV46_25470 [Solemya velum gill symbiont]